MVMEALTLKLKQLKGRLADLNLARRQTEQSDERAYTNGRVGQIDTDIAHVRKEIDNWYAANQLTFGEDKRVTISKVPGGFEVEITDLSRPGVMKTLTAVIAEGQADDMADYFGGRQVFLGVNYIDSIIAVEILKKENARVREEAASHQRLHMAALEQIAELEKKLEESDPPPRRRRVLSED